MTHSMLLLLIVLTVRHVSLLKCLYQQLLINLITILLADLGIDEIEIIDARDEEAEPPPNPFFEGDDLNDLPVLVFEGLPR